MNPMPLTQAMKWWTLAQISPMEKRPNNHSHLNDFKKFRRSETQTNNSTKYGYCLWWDHDI